MGASVRGAIDLVLILAGLARLRGERGMAPDTARDAAYAALSGRIRIADGCDRSPESVIDELLGQLWPTTPDADADLDGDDEAGPAPDGAPAPAAAGADGGRDGRGKADGLQGRPAGARAASASRLRRDRSGRGGRGSISRAELAARHELFGAVSPEVGTLDAESLTQLIADDPDAALTLLADLALATDRELRAAARRLAARIFIRLGTAGWRPSRGTRRLGPGRSDDGDLDLDRTLDRLDGAWPPPPDALVTRSWRARRRALCLLIDTSGSMSGHAVAIAAVAAASMVLAADGRLSPAIIAFGGDVTVLQAQGTARPAEELVGTLVGLRGHGLTDLAGALRAAARELATAAADERVTVLLSDCLHTTGADPASALAGIDRLHVLCPLPTPESELAAAALARRGGGISQPVRRLAEIAPALTLALSRPA